MNVLRLNLLFKIYIFCCLHDVGWLCLHTKKQKKKQSVVKVKFGKWGNTQSVLAAQCG